MSTPQRFSSQLLRKAWRSFPARRSRRRDDSATRCGCASPQHRPTAPRRRPARERLTDVPVSAAERAVLDKIDENHLVELARSLVRAAGQNPPGEEAATVAVLADAAAGLGLDVTAVAVQPGRDNLRVTLTGGDGASLLVLGHTDVVPVGDGWTKDPFGGVVADGRIYGRGTSDMKGGLAAALSAMAALRGTGLSGPVELAALVDEEENGIGIRDYVSAVPAGAFLGCITAEPTDLQIIVGARGA